jgi:type II secretory pathway pseudopilin PulG
MSAVTRIARRQAAAAWTSLLTMQIVLVVLTRSISARLRDPEAEVDPDAGFTLVEWVIMLVIIAAAAAAVATLIYNWITNKAKNVTNQ